MNAARLFTEELRRHGVEWIATLCGHGLDPLLESARQTGLRLVDVRNEQTCAYIADTFGRLTRRPGVCAVSSGVALVNALTGIANAHFAQAPMLLASGAGPTSTAGFGHFQDLDQVGLARPITKFSASIDDASRALPLLCHALAAAEAFPPGPVHLMFPLDVQETEVAAPDSDTAPAPEPLPEPDPAPILQALAGSRCPLVIAGSGVFSSGTGSALLRFCESSRIPLVTPIWDRGIVRQPSPVFLGVIGAATGSPAVLAEADCILLAGAAIDYRIGYLKPPAIRPDARIIDAGPAWTLPPESVNPAHEAWLAQSIERRDRFRAAVEHRAEEQAQRGLHALHIMRAIREVLSEDPVLLFDGGSIGQWAHQLLCRDRYPADWLTCGPSGVVGWGIAGAMAARLAFPLRPVILLSGDGAFTFNVADLESAARQHLPFVALVADDQAWGITRTGQLEKYGAPVASSLGPVAFDQLAASLGARGVRATTPDEIALALRRAIDEPAVTVIHVPIVGGNP